jgi:hypothetical protein
MRHLLLLLLCLLAPAWGATTATSFTGVGNGPVLQILPPLPNEPMQTGTYALTGTWAATMVWQYSTDANNWTTLKTYTANQAAVVFSQPAYYRLACTAFTSGTIVGTVVINPFIYQQVSSNSGNVLFQIDDSGVTAVSASPQVVPAGNQEAAFYQGNVNNYFELQVQNLNAGSSASSDLVATSNDGTATTHYVDLGINSSTGGAAPFTVAHGAYVYSSDNLLDVGAVGATGTVNIDVGATPTVVLNVDYANGVSINDVTTPSKQIRFLPSGATASTILTLADTQSTTQTLSFPNITGADTVDTLGLAQTITGAKTLSGITTVSNATASTTTGTGALVVTGGEGVGGAITGGSTITGTQLISTIATGTSPLAVTSTTAVANLNSSLLLGSTWASPGVIGNSSAAAGTFNALTSNGQFTNVIAGGNTAAFGSTGSNGAISIASASASVSLLEFLNNSVDQGYFQANGTTFLYHDAVNNWNPLTYTMGAVSAGSVTFASTLDQSSSSAAGLVDSGGLAVAKGANIGTTLTVGTTSSLNGVATIGAASVPSANTFAGNKIWGRNTAAADTAGAVGETITGAFSGVAAASTTTTGNVGSVSLTAGKWLISGKVVIHSGATGLTAGTTIQCSCPVATAGTGVSGTTMSQQSVLDTLTATQLFAMSVDAQVVNLSASASEFLTVAITYGGGSPTIDGSITATRLP